jgi:nonsense-mediated mRNA decay protein 3
LPKNIRVKLGGLPALMLVSKVTTAIHLIDPYTGRATEVQGTEYWKYPFNAVCTRKHLTEYTVLSVEPGEKGSKICNVEMARSMDLGVNDDRVIVRSHLGGATGLGSLKCGDLCKCYDLTRLNLSGANDEALEAHSIDLDVIIVKRDWESKKNKKRVWVLKRLKKEKGEDDQTDEAKEDEDMEEFKRDLETNPDLRREINLYRKQQKNAKAAGMLDSIDEEIDDHVGSEPDVDLAELLDELTLNENEETF